MRAASPTAASSRSARAKASRAPASSSGTATFSSAVMVGIRWKAWNTMPMVLPRKRASSSSPRRLNSSPATTTEPEFGRSKPVITMSSVDLPEPDGPSSATASPRPILRSMSRRIWTRPAPRPSERLTPRSAMASLTTGYLEMSSMLPTGPRLRSYALWPGLVQIAMFCFGLATPAPAQIGIPFGPYQVVALGDSLTAGYGLPLADGFVPRLQAALAAAGSPANLQNAGVSGDTATDGLARQALDEILKRLTGRRIVVLLCGMRAAPNLGPDYGQAFERVYPDLAEKYHVPLYPFFLDGVAGNLKLLQRD